MLASLPKIFEARPIRLSISGVERSDECQSQRVGHKRQS